MARTDLVLMHAPSVYDFREKPIVFGPVSDVVPSTQVFEMYPIGFLTLLEYLQRHGHSVRIVNVALRMLRSKRFRAEKLIESLSPVAFGLDLHWLVHAHGSLELARIIKEFHPETPVIFGGLSASYYHQELIRYPQVDYVIRGDSAEEPLRQLLGTIKNDGPLEDVPNLTWKDDSGDVRVNELLHVPSAMDDAASFDYRKMMRSSARHRDVMGHLPFLGWLNYPILAGLTCRGCVHSCVTCGGSASAFRRVCGRETPAMRNPELLARDIVMISRHSKAPIMVLGDILQGSAEYAQEFLTGIAEQRIDNHIALEFFSPPSRRLLETVASAIPNFNIQISPESHDEVVRSAFGRVYTNDRLETFIYDALELGCKRMDVFFMTGLPKQTPESVRGTIAYCEHLLESFGSRYPGRLRPFISPLAPFLDPGSDVFENPGEFGYRLFHRTLEEHRQALLSPSWKYTLNYETKWMSRDELVSSTYEAALGLNRLKLRYGLLRPKMARRIERRIVQEQEVLRELDDIMLMEDVGLKRELSQQAVRRLKRVGPSTICRKDEMNWPTGFIRLNLLRVLRGALVKN